jgi:hypothetical protein
MGTTTTKDKLLARIHAEHADWCAPMALPPVRALPPS